VLPSSAFLPLLLAAVAGAPRLQLAAKQRASYRSQLKRNAYEAYLVICKAQREQERVWRDGGKRPKWLRPHSSARSTTGLRWSKALNCWCPA